MRQGTTVGAPVDTKATFISSMDARWFNSSCSMQADYFSYLLYIYIFFCLFLSSSWSTSCDFQILMSVWIMLLTHALGYAKIPRGVSLVHALKEKV
jgi:hypothetical protein